MLFLRAAECSSYAQLNALPGAFFRKSKKREVRGESAPSLKRENPCCTRWRARWKPLASLLEASWDGGRSKLGWRWKSASRASLASLFEASWDAVQEFKCARRSLRSLLCSKRAVRSKLGCSARVQVRASLAPLASLLEASCSKQARMQCKSSSERVARSARCFARSKLFEAS